MKRRSEDCRLHLQITILWDDTVLDVREIRQGDSFWVGDGTRAGFPCDFVVPAEVLGASAMQLVDPKRVLAPGDRLETRVGPLTFVMLAHAADAKLASVLRSGRPWKHALYVAGSACLHGALLAAAMFYSPPLGLTDHEAVTRDQLFIMQQYLNASAEREMEERETEQVVQDGADNREGGSGVRGKGEEGSMGNPSSRNADKRYGVQGPRDNSDAHASRSSALRESAEFGMIGLLNHGAVGDPYAPSAPWGRDDSLGTDPISARGNLWGDAFGAGGLGLSGIGAGGGGRGQGIGAGTGAGSGRLAAPPPRPTYVEPEETPIDPNGRFATTYRPGHGHLAAFESAVARGILPPTARELVSDIGASYAPQIPPPKDRALAYEARTERASLPPSGGSTHVRLALRSSQKLPTDRPHLSVHLVLDVSGSMDGESILRAKEAANRLVDKLAPTDDFSLVTFSSGADVRVADQPVGPNRASIHRVIDQVRTEGGTNIEAGLRQGYAEAAKKTIPADAVRVVLLLSDGRANIGLRSRPQLSALALDAFQAGVQTSTFGLGADYDGELMSAVASDGAGAYYYLRDGEQIGPALATEVDKRLDPAATAVEVRVRLRDDIKLLRVYGSRRLGEEETARVRAAEVAADQQAEKKFAIKRDRQEDRDGGMRFFIPAFATNDAYALLIKVAAPAGTGSRDAGLVELRYKDRISSRNVYEEIPIRLSYASSDGESALTADASVTRTVQGFLAGETLLTAATRLDRGDRGGAALLLEERERILRQAATTLQEPGFVTDANRFARLRSHVDGRGPEGEPRALAMLLETAARSHLH
ncbi:MAG: VWA domain-containing protein [Deltaproteobacteria bacterium]|nr:VWA domain-containing protein [Deltaproteobacteria bacterium]